jgi:hypothetical protein
MLRAENDYLQITRAVSGPCSSRHRAVLFSSSCTTPLSHVEHEFLQAAAGAAKIIASGLLEACLGMLGIKYVTLQPAGACVWSRLNQKLTAMNCCGGPVPFLQVSQCTWVSWVSQWRGHGL